MKTLMSYWQDEEGLTTVEYALLLALVVVVAITAWQTLGTGVKSNVNTSLEALGETAPE
jgi:Flp pilus assembly pilin Flp